MNIHTYLSSNNQSLYSIAKSSGIPYTTLKELVSGKRKIENLPGKTILKLAKALDCTMEEVMSIEFSNDSICISSYKTKADYFKSLLRNYKNVVLAFDSALEFHRLSNDNNSSKVYCYSTTNLPEPFAPVVVPNFKNINYQIKDGVLVTSINQTFNDLLSDEDSDTQPIYEALNHYYYDHNESFDGLDILPQNKNRFKYLAEESIEYYSD